MTYCLGVLLDSGVLMVSDSRTSAGIDQIASVCKMEIFENGGTHFISILSAGNLATTQAVISTMRQSLGSGVIGSDLFTAVTMFDATQVVANTLRSIMARDADYVRAFGDPTGSFVVGGQVAGEPCRLFEIYPATNFIEAGPRQPFMQIGESKYGKPILDRAITPGTDMMEAVKLSLISFDATIRSNLSVGAPIDVMVYYNDQFTSASRHTFIEDDDYFSALRKDYADQLIGVVQGLPNPPLDG
ncbi:MAG: peptidase [Alphaproteobacteria bacterium]